jgi:DNA repair protein RecN
MNRATMLSSLYVKDFAIVGEAEVAFGSGLTVVTGETGAGKSLLVDALLLLAGARGDATMVRHGCERAELSAEFDLSTRADLRDWLAAEDLDEDGACQLRRVIRTEGSSRAWINGRPVTLGQLKTLAEGLIEIHGQHEHQALLDRGQQLVLLDSFGQHETALADVARHARAWREAGSRIAELSRGADHAERVEWLTHQVDELDRHALAPDDLAALEDTHRRLANSGQLLQGCQTLAERLDGDDEFALLRLVARAQGESRTSPRSMRASRRLPNSSTRRRSSSPKRAMRCRAISPRSTSIRNVSRTPKHSSASCTNSRASIACAYPSSPRTRSRCAKNSIPCAGPARASQRCKPNSNAWPATTRRRRKR